MSQQDLFSGVSETGHIVQGKYRLERLLSEGGGGVVWEALDPAGLRIALKFLKWNPTKTREAVADRFKNEFAILKSLSHPNIGQIFDFGLDPEPGSYFFTSELLTAGDLTKLLVAPVPLLEELLLQALRALEYLRGHKLLHLDIKPHNLLLRETGENPVLAMIDFGLATFRPPDRPGGTPNYMAPELIAMRLEDVRSASYPPPDHRSDLYSLGVTFYHCLTGRAPFNVVGPDGRKDSMATLHKHFDFTPPPPSALRPEIPAYLDRIIMKLMAHHPDDRYASALVAAQALQYSSPTQRDPECMQTLLAYLPKEGKLVGRHEECAIVEQSIKAIAEGTRHAAPIVVIAGSRGTGRTRMIEFAKPLAQQMEMDVTHVAEGQDLPPTIIESVESAGGGSAPVRALMVDNIDRFLIEDNGEPSDDARAQAIKGLVRRLRLQQKLPDSSSPRIILLATVNAERLGTAQAFEILNIDHALCHSVELTNFTKEDIAEYLETLMGERPDSSVVEQLAGCTGGNPLFLTEHLEQMISQGRLFSLAGRPDATTLKTIGIDFSKATPSRSLAESVLEKQRMLNEDAREVALAIACWQRPVSVEELSATCERRRVDKALLMLMEAGLAHNRRHDGRIEFSNEMAGRVIREAAAESERQACHDRIAGNLIAKFIGTRRKGRLEIDLHVAYGSNSPERIPALKRLIEAALESDQPLEAAEHLGLLLQLLPQSDAAGRAAALAQLGTAYELAHRISDARSALTAIKNLKAPSPLMEKLRVEAAERLGLLAMRRRDLREARRFFSEALSFLAGDGAAAKIRIENYVASVDLREGNIEKAIERFERSASVAEKILSAEQRRKIANNELGEALLALGRPADAVEILRKELALAEESSDAQKTASRHYLLGNALRHDELGKLDEARRHYEEGLKLARKHRLVEAQVRLLNGLGNLMLKIGKPKEALAHYQEGLKLAQQIEGETTGVEIMIGMGLAAQQMATPDNTIEYFEAALDFSGAPKSSAAGLIRRFRPTIYISLGDAYFQKHDFAHAESYLKKALAMDKKQRLTPDIRYSLYGTFAELALERGDRESAMRYMPTIEAIAKSFPPAKKHFSQLKKRIGRTL